MRIRGELAAQISRITGLPVDYPVNYGDNAVIFQGKVSGRLKPFSSDRANQPYRDRVVLEHVTRTERGITNAGPERLAAAVDDLILRFLARKV